MGDQDFYKNVCEKRFDDHTEALKAVDIKVDNLMVVVNNGLSSRVKRIDKLIWLIAAVVVGKIIVEVFI